MTKFFSLKVGMRIFVLMIFSVFSLFSYGCSKDMKEAEKKIVEFDPTFKKNLEKRNSLRKMISDQEKLYSGQKSKIAEQIRLLKAKDGELSRQNVQNIENIRQQIEPERRQLRRAIIEKKREHEKVIEALADINKDIREINKLVEKKEDLSLTQEELSTWNDRLGSLMKRRTLKESERLDLEREISVAKMKLKVMSI